MIKVETQKGIFNYLEVRGGVVEITADLLSLIRMVWAHLDEGDKGFYKKIMTKSIETAFMDESELEKMSEEAEKALRKGGKLDELSEALKSLNELLDSLVGKDDEDICNKA